LTLKKNFDIKRAK